MKTLLPAILFYLSCINTGFAQVPLHSSNPAAPAVIFLDFDGHTVVGTSWNQSGPIYCGASGLDPTQITAVFHRVAEDYRPFNVNITTDSTKFLQYPLNRRMRIIITVTSDWYGQAGGVAFVGSFTWGDDTPAFVFSASLEFQSKYVGEAVAHEAGHTLGLYHQSMYDSNCVRLSEYNYGNGAGEIGWAPIMGAGYYRNFTVWNNGPNPYGCNNYQGDLEIITSGGNGFTYRNDDHQEKFNKATKISFVNNQFNLSGIIERSTDMDLFRFVLPARKRFRLSAVPYNMGTGNEGADLDLQVTLFQSEAPLQTYNPGTLLNSFVDTILNAGTYYLKTEGTGNIYATDYASLGSYSLQGIMENETAMPVPAPVLVAGLVNDKHELKWTVDAGNSIKNEVVEMASDGRNFYPISTLENHRSYLNNPVGNTTLYYRLKVNFEDGRSSYSNTVSFKPIVKTGPRLVSSLVTNNTVAVQSSAPFHYFICDLHGIVMAKGQLSGSGNIQLPGTWWAGTYIIRFVNQDGVWNEKFIRQ